MTLEKGTIYEPTMQLVDGEIRFVLKDTFGRVIEDMTAEVLRILEEIP